MNRCLGTPNPAYQGCESHRLETSCFDFLLIFCSNNPSLTDLSVNPNTGYGVRYLKKDHVASKEYRYGCSIDCGGTPLRVYERTLGSQGSWTSLEDYLQVGRSLWYDGYQQIKFPAGRLIRNPNNSTVMDWRDANGNPVECIFPSACNPVEAPTQGCPHGSGRSACIWNGGCDSLPFFPLPPSGEGGKRSGLPIYGNWCGPGHPPKDIRDYEKPYPAPVDYLDGCCKDHDKCYDDNNCAGWCWLTSLQCRVCDCI